MIDAEKLMDAASTPRGAPTGYSTEYDGETGTINTPLMQEKISDFDGILTAAGFDPDEFEVAGHPKVKTWDGQRGGETVRLFSYALSVRHKPEGLPDVGDLVSAIHAAPDPVKDSHTSPPGGTAVFAVGDLQLGKSDGDGSAGIVRRFKQSVESGVVRYKEAPTDSVLIAFLGDCVEGVVSQGGKNIANNDLSLTDQLRVLRHLMTYALLKFTEVCDSVTVASVPGNHDEAHRSPVNAQPTDSFAVDSLRAVEEAFVLSERGNLPRFVYPEKGALAIEVTSGVTTFLLAHGHQWRTGKHFDWWKGMAFSHQPGGQAEYLLAGHRHHFEVDTESHRFFIQVPAMESRSNWWVNKTGQIGNPGAVYLVPGINHQPRELAVV